MTVTPRQRHTITLVADLLERLAQQSLHLGLTGDLAYRAAAGASELRSHSHSPHDDRPRLCRLLDRIQTLTDKLFVHVDAPQAEQLRDLTDQAAHRLGCR